MTIKTCKTAVRASTLLAAIALSGGAFAAGVEGDSYTFATEAALGSETYPALNGNGTVVADGYSYTVGAGKPLSGADGNVLEIAGTVTYTNSAASMAANTSSQVDFMFKVEPTDELENPDGADIQVALAVGETNATPVETAPIKLWCKTTSDAANAGWVTLKESVGTGAWVRATLVLDYSDTAKKCKVSLDGDPVLNGTSEWFYFAGTPAQQFVKSISMVGSTKIDELKVSYTTDVASYSLPGGNTTVAGAGAVTYDYINKYGVTVAQAASSEPLIAESGMTVAQKFEAGLDPKSATKFELQTMTTTKSTATVTFPGANPVGSYKVSAKTAGGTEVATGTISKSSTDGENVNSAEIAIPSANQNELLYFTVETVAQ